MSKSYAELADEILKGALTDPSKNPYDPKQGHQAHMPSMNANDKLVEMNDAQRTALIKGAAGVSIEEIENEPIVESTSHTVPDTQSLAISEEDLRILNEAKRVIERIQEATTAGCIGVNLAGNAPAQDPKKPAKRAKKKTDRPKNKNKNDFLTYLGGEK